MTLPERFAPLPRLGALLLMTCVLCGCAGGGARGPQAVWQGDRATVVLEYRGDARSISAVGDFNGWNPGSSPFIEVEKDRWSCKLSLPSGKHGYLLAVETDSRWTWQLDLANPERTKDGLGRELSLLVVGSASEDYTGAP